MSFDSATLREKRRDALYHSPASPDGEIPMRNNQIMAGEEKLLAAIAVARQNGVERMPWLTLHIHRPRFLKPRLRRHYFRHCGAISSLLNSSAFSVTIHAAKHRAFHGVFSAWRRFGIVARFRRNVSSALLVAIFYGARKDRRPLFERLHIIDDAST